MHGFETPKRSLYTPVDAEPARKLSYFKLALITVCFLGVQFGWAIQIAFTSPIFMELGVPQFWLSFIWLAGPISGLLVQPVVGAVSDGLRSPWGRRRPFIFFGAIFIIIGLALISNASDIGVWMGDTGDSHVRGIVMAIIGFWILDLSNNTVQGPCRALLVDVAPPEQQAIGGSFFSFMLGIGSLVGYFTGHLKLTKFLPFMGTDTRALLTIAMIVLAVCICLTVFTTKEPPFMSEGPMENPFKKIYVGLIKMPSIVFRVCIVQFFVWVGWFTYIVYMSTWVGVEIYKGNATAPVDDPARIAYDDGVRAASLAMMFNAAVTMVFSPLISLLIPRVGIKAVYFVGNIMLGLLLISTIFINNMTGAYVVIALCGVPWSITMVLPFTIIGQGVDAADSGLYMGALNIFVVLPQLIIAVTGGFLVELFNNNVASAMVAGGIASIIGAFFVFRLIVASPATDVKDPSLQYMPVSINNQMANDNKI